jgi:ABC-type dipeptide/oligopeptide/nickel transport system ATPase component
MIFQEPMTSLNPLHDVERQVSEPLFVHKRLSRPPPAPASWSCSASSACPTLSPACAPTRTSSPAASASG